jgi:hypothetical protein
VIAASVARGTAVWWSVAVVAVALTEIIAYLKNIETHSSFQDTFLSAVKLGEHVCYRPGMQPASLKIE